jgi:hypothetical protein
MRDHRATQRNANHQKQARAVQPVVRIDSPAAPSQFPAMELGALGDDILVVSGLPRSGTSMLMQMLEAGGMPILSDRRRQADEDNPRGYFELEAVKKMQTDQSWMGEARGKAVKIIAPLVCGLPPCPRYRVILMERDYREILDSQAKMIARRGGEIQDTPQRRQRLASEYDRVMQRTRRTLSARPDVHLLILRYQDVVRDPATAALQIKLFLGSTLSETRMAAAVEPSLHRNRGADGEAA